MCCNTLEEIWFGPLSLGIQLDSLAGLIMLQHSLEWLEVPIEIISTLFTQYQTLYTIRFLECNFSNYDLFDYLGICQSLKFHNCDFPKDQDP